MKKNYKFFWYQEGFLNTYTQNIIWYNTNYVRKNNVFTYHMLLLQYRCQNYWFDGKHNAKVWKVNLHPVNVLQSLLCRNHFFWHLSIFALTFSFYVSIFLYLSVIDFTPFTRVLVTETYVNSLKSRTQSLVILICIW